MSVNIEHNHWIVYFKEFNQRNRWRLTRLMPCDATRRPSVTNTMPLVGVSLETDHEGSTRIHVLLNEHDAMAPRHVTYTITGVTRVTSSCDFVGRDETLEIEDEHGEKNFLRFAPL